MEQFTVQKVKDIEAKEGRTENWSKAYKQWAESIDAVTSKIKTLKKEQSNVASTQVFNTSDLKANNIAYMSKVHNTIEKQMIEINRLANANGWSDVKVTGVEEASGKIQKLTLTVRDAEGALKQFNMQREKIQGNGKTQAGLVQTGDVKVLETAVQYAEKLKSIESSMGQFGNTTTSIANLETSFTKLGLSTDEVNSKMSAVKTEYATLQNMMSNGASGNEIVNQFEKVNSVLKETQNSLKQTKADYSLLATEYQRLTLANDIEEWNQKNTAATREVIAQNEIYISSLRDLDVAMTKVEHNNIATSFKQTENSMRALNKLGASFSNQLRQAIDSFKVWVSATTVVMGAVNLIRQIPTVVKQYLGSEYQRIILSNNLADIENFKNQYVAVESQINSNEQLKTSYEEKVDYYNNLKQQWEDCTSKYDDEKNKLYASQILGANWEAEVLSGRQQTLANFTSEYERLCQRQADAAVNAANTEVQAAKNAAAGIASVSSSVASSGGGSSSGGSSGGSSSSTHKVTYDKNNNPNKPALKSNDYWTYEKLSKKGYSTSGQASSHISDYASKGANGFTQIGNKYFIVKWIANAGSPANASKAKNKLEKDNPKKIGKYGYAKRYHKGLELGKIEALPKDKAFDLVQDVGTNGLEADEVPIIAQKGEAVLTEEQIENLAKTLHLVPVQNEIMEKMSKISLGDLPMNTPKMNFDASKVGQNVTKNNFAPNVNITFNCPNLTNESGVQYVEKAMDKYMNKFANDFYQASLHYVNRKQ